MSGSNSHGIAFIISHRNQLKLYLPIFENSHGRSFVVFHKNIREDDELKMVLESRGHKYKTYLDDNDLSKFLKNEEVNTLITESIALVNLKNKIPSLKVFYLQHSHDIISVFSQNFSLETLDSVDKFLLFSNYWKEEFINSLLKRFGGNLKEIQNIKEKTVLVGFPEIEQIKNFSKQDILKKFNLQTSKKIIFFDPIGTVNHVGNVFFGYFFKLHGTFLNKIKLFIIQFFYDAYHHPFKIPKILFLILKLHFNKEYSFNNQSLVEDLRTYCDKNDALLVVKSREKNNDPEYIKNLTDYYSYDLEFYPFTLLELLFVSDLYIGFNSSTTMEAVASSTNAMQINVCPKEYQYTDYGGGIYNYLDLQLSTEHSWINYPGIVSILDRKTTVKDSIDDSCFIIDQDLQNAYIKKFLIDLENGYKRIMNNIFN